MTAANPNADTYENAKRRYNVVADLLIAAIQKKRHASEGKQKIAALEQEAQRLPAVICRLGPKPVLRMTTDGENHLEQTPRAG